MNENEIKLISNGQVLNHLLQNNQTQAVTRAIGIFEQRVYDYLMQGIGTVGPATLRQLEEKIPKSFSEAERLQILNYPPRTLPQLYSCVYNAQDRYSLDFMEELLETIQKTCGFEVYD